MHRDGGASPLPAAFRQLFDAASFAPANWPERMSVPITRIVWGLTARNGLPWSVLPMSVSLPFWIWDEISNARKLITIHARAAIPTHLRTRRQGDRSLGGALGLPGPRRSGCFRVRSRSFERLGERRRLRSPGRDL